MVVKADRPTVERGCLIKQDRQHGTPYRRRYASTYLCQHYSVISFMQNGKCSPKFVKKRVLGPRGVARNLTGGTKVFLGL